MARPDLPRWMLSGDVDTNAMFLAYKEYLHQCLDDNRDGEVRELRHLWVKNHKRKFNVFDLIAKKADPAVLEIECDQQNCKRCDSLSGGYSFRWYDQRWYQHYVRDAHPSSWRRSSRG
jgi:hypothetical protein